MSRVNCELSLSKLFRVICSLGAIQAAQMLLPLFALPYLARVLGQTAFGILLFMLTAATFYCLCLEWGFALWGTRKIAHARSQTACHAQIFIAVLTGKCLLILFGAVVLCVLLPYLPYAEAKALHVAAYAYGAMWALSPVWFLQGRGEGLGTLARWDVLGNALLLLVLPFWIHDATDTFWYLILLCLEKTVCYGAISVNIIRQYGWGFTTLLGACHAGCHALLAARIFFLSRLAAILSAQGLTFMLGWLLSPAALGLIISAEKIARAGVSIAHPVTQALFPEICALQETQQQGRILRYSLAGTLTIALLLALALAFAAPVLVPFVFGKGYEAVIPILRIYCLYIPVLACNFMLGIQVLIPFGLEKAMTVVQGIIACCALPCAAVLTGLYGIAGAVWIAFFIESLICIGYLLCIRRYCPRAFC
jgi:PST family polysaccharide transporter